MLRFKTGFVEVTNSFNSVPSYSPRKLNKFQANWNKFVFGYIVSPIVGYVNSKKDIKENDLKNITVEQVAGIDRSDHPDYVDAYIVDATWDNSLTSLTETQLDQVNDKHTSFVYQAVIKQLY